MVTICLRSRRRAGYIPPLQEPGRRTTGAMGGGVCRRGRLPCLPARRPVALLPV